MQSPAQYYSGFCPLVKRQNPHFFFEFESACRADRQLMVLAWSLAILIGLSLWEREGCPASLAN
ncbi:MAG TPA: hypothetical protein VFU22_25965, partial [Roseiflexaceae bacterium]|nr:hypothetical protein [Roseiflexaceae bacterium]